MPGLLINGNEVAVEGLVIINPNDAEWCRLDAKDFRTRPTPWVRQIILHTTKGDSPQTVLPGKGPGGRAKATADIWRSDPTPSAAHLVIDNDGTVACLCDLATTVTFHATVSNAWSIGIEMFGIQFQIPRLPYKNEPLRRMVEGGEDCVGVFGHRDNTARRGAGDPGD